MGDHILNAFDHQVHERGLFTLERKLTGLASPVPVRYFAPKEPLETQCFGLETLQ